MRYLLWLIPLLFLGCGSHQKSEEQTQTKQVQTPTAVKPATLEWEKSIADAIAKGKKMRKPVMILVSKDGCHWCDHLRETTLSNSKVIAKLSQDFIIAEGYVNRGEVPRELYTSGTPVTWFLKNGEPMFQPMMGSVPVSQYLEALDIVLKEFKKIK